nr:haloacid dehalogenase-like hydrolase domain-containing protein At2g33255 [Tanacetum cinerariifolium]
MSCVNLKPKTKLKGIVFDMDGTLTVPVIDFQAMYKSVLGEDEYFRIKKSSPTSGGIDILHLIENWTPDKQLKAYQVIADYEQQGMDKLQIMPGIVYVSYLSQNSLARINRVIKAVPLIFVGPRQSCHIV